MKEHRLYTFWPSAYDLFHEKRIIRKFDTPSDVPSASPDDDKEAVKERAKEKAKKLRENVEKIESPELKEKIAEIIRSKKDEIDSCAAQFFMELAPALSKVDPSVDLEEIKGYLPTTEDDVFELAVVLSPDTLRDMWDHRGKSIRGGSRRRSSRGPRRSMRRASKPDDLPSKAQTILEQMEKNRIARNKNISARGRIRRNERWDRGRRVRDYEARRQLSSHYSSEMEKYRQMRDEFEKLTGISYSQYLRNAQEAHQKHLKKTGFGMGRERYEESKAKLQEWRDKRDAEQRAREEMGRIQPYTAFEQSVGGQAAIRLREERLRVDRRQRRSQEAWKALGLDGEPDAWGEKRLRMPSYQVGLTPEQKALYDKYGLYETGTHYFEASMRSSWW